MIIYKDFISDGEMFTDAFKIIKVNDYIWEVEGRSITVKEGVDGALLGANPSAEEAEEVDDSISTVIDLVYSHQLSETSVGTKKDYMLILKDYLKVIKTKLEDEKASPEKIKGFTEAANNYLKTKLLNSFENWTFYMPQTSKDEYYFIPMNYREDEITPYFVFFANGLIEQKA